MRQDEREIRKTPKIADDEVYGKIRAQICDEYIAAGKPTPEKNWLYSKLIILTLEHADLERTFEMTWEAQMRAVKVWREANPGNDLVLPDHQKLVEFLLSLLDAERKRVAKWQTLFYESEEENCSCNIVDTSKPVGDPYNYICNWHQRHPHIAVAREEVITLSERVQKLEGALEKIDGMCELKTSDPAGPKLANIKKVVAESLLPKEQKK